MLYMTSRHENKENRSNKHSIYAMLKILKVSCMDWQQLVMTGAGKAVQSSSDGGNYALELNAAATSGVVSTQITAPATNTSANTKHQFVLLFDSAANPRQEGPQSDSENATSPYAISGRLGIKVQGGQTNKLLLDAEYDMNSTGFTSSSVGWVTLSYNFTMEVDRSARLSFRSLATDMSFGPFVDNVAVYEVEDKNEWIKLNTPKKADAANHAATTQSVPQWLQLSLLVTSLALLSLL